jgi:hypothetical protein
MFAARRARKAAQAHQQALREWQARRAEYAELLRIAQSYPGSIVSDLMLAAGERVFYTIMNVGLIEERPTAGHYSGRSAGISIPAGTIGGRTLRYHVGASRGHYAQGSPVPTAVDHGAVHLTNLRVIFAGARQTRECAFARLIGFQHDDEDGSTTFSVRDRQKPTTVHYGRELSASFDFRLDLALAHFRGTVPGLIRHLQADMARLDRQQPGSYGDIYAD